MFKNFLSLFIISLFLISQAFGDNSNVVPEGFLRSISSVYLFKGDRHHQFAGNYVAVLNDGSEWKVHPEDSAKYREWNINDIVHPRFRTSSYWFKREHHFKLYNHNRNETVRVMLVRHATVPFQIIDKQTVEVNRRLCQEIDEKGFPQGNYWTITYRTYLYLNDSSIWAVDDLQYFENGKFIYIGLDSNSDGFTYFFIAGTEREAVWSKATPICNSN